MKRETTTLKTFEKYNGFYKKPGCREVVAEIYKYKCQKCRHIADLDGGHVGHFVPQSKPEILHEIFGDELIDIHNIINLIWLCSDCNRELSDAILFEPQMIYTTFTANADKVMRYFSSQKYFSSNLEITYHEKYDFFCLCETREINSLYLFNPFGCEKFLSFVPEKFFECLRNKVEKEQDNNAVFEINSPYKVEFDLYRSFHVSARNYLIIGWSEKFLLKFHRSRIGFFSFPSGNQLEILNYHSSSDVLFNLPKNILDDIHEKIRNEYGQSGSLVFLNDESDIPNHLQYRNYTCEVLQSILAIRDFFSSIYPEGKKRRSIRSYFSFLRPDHFFVSDSFYINEKQIIDMELIFKNGVGIFRFPSFKLQSVPDDEINNMLDMCLYDRAVFNKSEVKKLLFTIASFLKQVNDITVFEVGTSGPLFPDGVEVGIPDWSTSMELFDSCSLWFWEKGISHYKRRINFFEEKKFMPKVYRALYNLK